ncbi:10282_t:CDS:2 [Funneliformis geosporum]|nr:10282_t:CDS:2 [Funneliformis geosporum]
MEFYQGLSLDFSHLLDESDDYDVIIYAGKEPNVKKFHAHTVILRARSPYFRRALSRDWARKENGSIVFQKPNIAHEVFDVILKYIYSGTADLLVQEGGIILNLLTASDELNLQELIVYAQDHLIQQKSDWLQENVIQVLHTVGYLEACKDLQNFCLGLICQDPDYWDKLRPFRQILPSKLHEDLLQYYCKRGNISQTDTPILSPRKAGIQSNIIKFKHISLITKWIDRKEGSENTLEKSQYNFNRILCGSDDGFTAANFHKKCDGRGPTLIIIKVKESGEIIGGYNPISWRGSNNPDSSWSAPTTWTVSQRSRTSSFGSFSRSTAYELGPYQNTPNSFIFSLGDGKGLLNAKISRILQDNTSAAVFSSPRHGPCFGQTDLRMNDNFNEAETCTCQCYDYESEITENHNFSVEEYEVFQVINKDGPESSNQASTSQMLPPELTNYPSVSAW